MPDILEESGQLGIKGAIVISAGFKEVGNIELENRLKEIIKLFEKIDIKKISALIKTIKTANYY